MEVTQHAEGSKQVHESVTVKQTDTISLTDSAYQSMSTDIASVATASGSTYGSNQTRILIRPIPGSDLLMFRKAGDKIITEEYRNIQRALEKRLKDVLTTARQNMSNLSTHLEMVGRNYSEATPKLVVLCAPAAEDAVRSFFQLVYVQTLLSLGDPDNAPLKHIIVPQAPNFASAIENIRVFAQNTHNTDRSTYCGAPITFASHDRKRKRSMPSLATFGGIVKATFGNGETQLLGTSAGHAVGRVRTEHLSVDTDGKAGDQSSQQTFDLLDWIPAECAIGGILLPESFRGVSAGRTAPSYDWTLFSVNAARPNQVIKRGSCVENDAANDVEVHSILKAERPLFQDEVSDPVLLLGAVGGVRRGELSSVPSRIWLTESEGFVDAYLLQLEDGTVCEGDSGAWIVHSAAPEMYGHVVATNVFGDAYVMPALDTFENMRECLGAISVTLPDAHDLEGVTIPTEIATSYKNSNSRPGTPLSVKLSPDGQSSTIASESSNFESPSMPDSAKFLRNRPKRWNPIFKEQRHSHEQNYLQTLAEVGVDIHDVPKAFLTGSLMQGTERMQDFALQTVKDFCRHGLPQACKHVTNSTSLSKRAWMVEVRERTCLEPITREQHLYSNARELFRHSPLTRQYTLNDDSFMSRTPMQTISWLAWRAHHTTRLKQCKLSL
ncbi:uncharacterized protein K460DRAFT_50841 [Cucurbitaria berberidis CBS 394.84]|uniref:Uncharacterized protein n=1 Tax=Cucurbitaria berberidis CBS 394.84 TaxID=1168544 RepID=A0A9P4GKW1_9PLEO|nr:uncharacterized protein K460DRAFT_50841 [Cucurbitaria berberidis CBS 394.84]KAF1846956.1 hypothetical protein K460DRAFT_50841 [Cucurbitaria berberidis CBS 394.84]